MLTIIRKLEQLNIDKVKIERLIKEITSSYFKQGSVSTNLETTSFNYDATDDNSFNFNERLMLDYLKSELSLKVTEITKNINLLSEVNK